MNQPPVFQDLEKIVLNREGVFLSDGEPITHERTVDAFHRHLRRDGDGWVIVIGNNTKRIEVEDTGRFVIGLEWSGEAGTSSEKVELRLADGAIETLDPRSLKHEPGRLTCLVKGGVEEAKFLRDPYHDFLMRALKSEDPSIVALGGRSYRIGK